MKVSPSSLMVFIAAALEVSAFAQNQASAPENYGVERAKASLSLMRVADGLTVSLFASEAAQILFCKSG
jgi:hypothetical protein